MELVTYLNKNFFFGSLGETTLKTLYEYSLSTQKTPSGDLLVSAYVVYERPTIDERLVKLCRESIVEHCELAGALPYKECPKTVLLLNDVVGVVTLVSYGDGKEPTLWSINNEGGVKLTTEGFELIEPEPPYMHGMYRPVTITERIERNIPASVRYMDLVGDLGSEASGLTRRK